jgi:polar amino acid transport system substrate-binding protein
MIRTLTSSCVALVLILTGCSSADTSSPAATTSPAGDPNTDKLAQILDRGTLVGYFEPEFPPQSFAVEGAERPEDTRCSGDQSTAAEVTGYDIQTTVLVAEALGVEACFVTPTWTEVTAGNWGDRFDIVYGSGSINEERMAVLWMTQPYYAVPASYFVQEDAPFDEVSDLDGKEIGVCASCSHEMYLRGELVIPGVEIPQTVQDPRIVTYQIETPGLEALDRGEIDAFLCADPVGEGQIEEGLALRKLDPAAYLIYPSGFVDKGSGFDVGPFIERVNAIIQAAQADGTMRTMSQEWFGTDYATAGAEFDVDALGQEV